MIKEGLQRIDPRELREAAENPRTIRDKRYADLKHSIASAPDMLEARPIIGDVEAQDVPCGNMRLRVVLELLEEGDERFGTVPVYGKKFSSAGERREWMLRDNAGYGEWVPDELAQMVALHKAEGGDLTLLGFDAGEAQSLLLLGKAPPEQRGEGDPDAAPEPPQEPRTRPGDLYRLGPHVLLCADAAHPQSYSRLLEAVDGDEWEAVWTDPPYGVGYTAEDRHSYFSPERMAKPFGEIEGDHKQAADKYASWIEEVLTLATGALAPGGAVYLCHADLMIDAVARAWRRAGLYYASQLIWRKSALVFGRSDYHYQHEPMVYGWKTGAAHRWFGDRKQTTVFDVSSEHYSKTDAYVHPTQKPYDLIAPQLLNSTEEGDLVLDAFAGSGSTVIAGHRLGRRVAALELDRRYCDVIVDRMRAFDPEVEITVEHVRRPDIAAAP